MEDSCGFEITEGLYSDSDVFHYYHIKQTPEGFFIREANEKQYSPLKQPDLTSKLVRLIRQDELIALINSVEKEQVAQSQLSCTDQTSQKKHVYYADDLQTMREAQRD